MLLLTDSKTISASEKLYRKMDFNNSTIRPQQITIVTDLQFFLKSLSLSSHLE